MSGRRAYYAKAKRKNGELTGTESRYRDYLQMLKKSGHILEYWHEPFNIRIAEGVYYKADFMVLGMDGVLEIHEVKGSAGVIEEKVVIKAKIVAERFPFRMMIVWPKLARDGRGWNYRCFDEDSGLFGGNRINS